MSTQDNATASAETGKETSTTSNDGTKEFNNSYLKNINPIKQKRRNNHIHQKDEDSSSTQEKEVAVESSGAQNEDTSVSEAATMLANLKLAPQDHIQELDRVVCPKCMKKRKYFCYECLVPMGDPSLVPFIPMKLPLEVDMYVTPITRDCC